MKKGNIILLSILAVLVLLVFNACGSYNNMNERRTVTEGAWAKVQSAYQHRLDLIPNLVATVKGAANFEQKTLTDVIEARAKASSIQVDPDKLTPENIKKFQGAQGELSQALGRLMVVSEQYPQLRATQNFSELQSQIEGTENRIKVERDNFNDAVTRYNVYIKNFPQVIYSGIFGFEKKVFFEADAAAAKAPEVKF